MEINADQLLSDAIDLARAAAIDEARASGLPYEGELVGEHLGVEVDGEGRQIFKDPITDDGRKKSARGLLQVVRENGVYKLNDQVSWDDEKN